MTVPNIIERAHRVLPGGTFGNFDPNLVIDRGEGARVWDITGKEYVDYLIGSGPMILGHSNLEVLDAIEEQIRKGTTFFTNNERAIELAEEICKAVACAEKVRYVSTGGEADMYAMRLARAFTKREKLVKFEGGYHGMSSEAQMSLAPKQLKNFPNAVPDSAGIPSSVANEILIAPYNDIDFIRSLISEHHNEIAAIIVEPLQRIIPPAPGFLNALREECTKYGIILIFDEVVTGFRLAYGGAQEYFDVVPDICTLGKIIGGGFPLAAIAGKEEIMMHFDPSMVKSEDFLMQIGTLSGNPVAAVAGLKTLEILRRPGQYQKFNNIGQQVMNLFQESLAKTEVEFQILGCPVLFDIVFSKIPINNYRQLLDSDSKSADKFNASLRKHGILKPPGKIYSSLALTELDIAFTAQAINRSVQEFNN